MERNPAGAVGIAMFVACTLVTWTASAGDPVANRKASANYDAVIRDNPAFRDNRQHAECDSIASLDLRAQCVASFEQPTPTRPSDPVERARPQDPQHPVVTITNGPVRNPDDD